MVDYSPSIEFYNKAKEFSGNDDYRSALIYIRLAFEALMYIRLDSENIEIHNSYNTETKDDNNNLNFTKTFKNKQCIFDAKKDLKRICNRAAHYYKNQLNFHEKDFEQVSINLEKILIELNIENSILERENLILDRRVIEQTENKFKSTYFNDSDSIKNDLKLTALNILKKLHQNLISKSKVLTIKGKFIDKSRLAFYRTFFTRKINNVSIDLEIAIKLTSKTVEYAGANFGISINFNIGSEKTEINVKEKIRDLIFKSLKENSYFDSMELNKDEKWIFEKEAEKKNVNGYRPKVGLFIPVSFDLERKMFDNQDYLLTFVAESFLNLTEMLNNLKSK